MSIPDPASGLPAAVDAVSISTAIDRLLLFANLEPGEPRNRDVFTGPGVYSQDDVTDGLGVVLDELLVEQDALREPRVEFALGDFLLDILWFVGHLRHEDPFLLG